MKVVDLTPGYITNVINDDNFFKYEKLYPSLFDHYYRFWATHKAHDSIYKKEELLAARDLTVAGVKKILPKFHQHDLELKEFKLVLFVGEGTTNGHAFLDGDQWVIWLPVETYLSEINVLVFATHEFLHGIHYRKSPDFYYHNVTEKDTVARLLMSEGIVTYLTGVITGLSDEQVLWGDYLEKKPLAGWMAACQENYPQIKAKLKEHFYSSTDGVEMFWAADKTDVFKFRSGYYAGLYLIREIVEKANLKPVDLLSISRTDMEKALLSLL